MLYLALIHINTLTGVDYIDTLESSTDHIKKFLQLGLLDTLNRILLAQKDANEIDQRLCDHVCNVLSNMTCETDSIIRDSVV